MTEPTSLATLATSRGARTVPVSAAAATIAMASGETSTRPCPMEVAARSAASFGRGTEPPKATSPMCGFWPSPSICAVDGKSDGDRCPVASLMKAVLHDSVNACSRLLTGASLSALWNTSPSTVAVPGQLAADRGVSPWLISAVDVITLNVEPGGKPPSMAWSNPPALTDTAASTAPVEAFTATSAALFFCPASAVSAARCTDGSIVVLTGVPGRGASVASVATRAPRADTTDTVAPGVPASLRSSACSRPVWPTEFRAVYGAPSWLSSCAVTGPTVPTTPAVRPGVSAVSAVLDWNTVPGIG